MRIVNSNLLPPLPQTCSRSCSRFLSLALDRYGQGYNCIIIRVLVAWHF